MPSFRRELSILSALLVLIIIGLSTEASAMPNFSRKYNLGCASCHMTIPRLNEFGFKFRAAGFRIPDMIGKSDSTFNLGDYIAVDIVGQAAYAGVTPPGAATTSTTSLSLGEVGLHPLTGSLTSNLSSDVQLTITPGPGLDIENAYGRYNTGKEDAHFSARVGIMHPFEGYGASDEPMGLSRPLFQVNAPSDVSGSTLFTPWGFNQFGAEVGYTINRTALRASVLSGIYTAADGSAHPAQGGQFVKPTGAPSSSTIDLQLFATQILTEEGGGVSGYFYLGQADLATGIAAKDSSMFQNKYLRYAIYGSYPILKGTLLAGFEQGMDNTWNTAMWRKGSDFKSQGWFAEADYTPLDLFGFGVRYDQFRPSTTLADNDLSAIAGFVNYAFGNGLQVVGEYQHLTTKMGAGQQQANNNFGISLIWIQ
jgi:hypothetical protein